jgi:hypothetical protein
MERRPFNALQRTKPKRPNVERFGRVVDECFCCALWEGQVLDHLAKRHVAPLKRAVEHAGVHKVVEKPAGETVEGDKGEVLEGFGPNPEAPAVVAEEVLGNRDVIRGRFDSNLVVIWFRPGLGLFLGVQVEPWVPGTAECLRMGGGRAFIGECPRQTTLNVFEKTMPST